MAGLYIHIPFCKQACYYCDFHFSTNHRLKQNLVQALCLELALQKDYLGTRQLDTIYLGGGTPSLLTEQELSTVFEAIFTHFTLSAEAEITLEANPDDLSTEKIRQLRQHTPVNRLSIGIQSFYTPHLVYMHRSHNAHEAEICVRKAQEAGFTNISIDLIYGIPHPDHSVWQADLQKALALDVGHISAYCLTIEPQTVFGKWVKQKKIQPVDEEFSAEQFEQMTDILESSGFVQYEISNFARPGCYSRHNSSYWLQKPYLGIGPSAHSFNGQTRQYTVSNNTAYCTALEKGVLPCTIEELTTANQINEYLLTSLRTSWGCDLKFIQNTWQYDLQQTHHAYLQQCYRQDFLIYTNGTLILTKKGKLLADEITASLMLS